MHQLAVFGTRKFYGIKSPFTFLVYLRVQTVIAMRMRRTGIRALMRA